MTKRHTKKQARGRVNKTKKPPRGGITHARIYHGNLRNSDNPTISRNRRGRRRRGKIYPEAAAFIDGRPNDVVADSVQSLSNTIRNKLFIINSFNYPILREL